MGNKLKELRLKRGLTQENLAFELGISQKAYSKIENGKVCLSLDKMKTISNVLNVSIDNLCKLECECSKNNSKLSSLVEFINSKGLELPEYLK